MIKLTNKDVVIITGGNCTCTDTFGEWLRDKPLADNEEQCMASCLPDKGSWNNDVRLMRVPAIRDEFLIHLEHLNDPYGLDLCGFGPNWR